MKQITVFFISDRTGITAETLGLSLISQFESIPFKHVTIPFVDSGSRAHKAVDQINLTAKQDGSTPIIFATMVKEDLRTILRQAHALYLDFFETFIGVLENQLNIKSTRSIGKSHGLTDQQRYKLRMDAVTFALNYDDGAKVDNYAAADLILIGVSRCGKTPTSLYLALRYGVLVANFPLVDEDLERYSIPPALKGCHSKLFGLSIDPLRLQNIREERRPNTHYANLKQCIHEVNLVEKMYHHEKIPHLNSTNHSIEELASKIMMTTGLENRLHKS
ncbi:MAG TPA: pyruvate, water dikinase regulatory protein [Gammaproteobacteria bacterium]|nr:pyruvate, water dikinase regulatory protein [Gammaproteobacteria bacterium]